MPNDIYHQVHRELATMISGRAASRILNRALRSSGYAREAVTAFEMRTTLMGPILQALSATFPKAGLHQNLRRLGKSLVEAGEAQGEPPGEPASAAELIDTGAGNGKQTLSSFPAVEAHEERPATTVVVPQPPTRDNSADPTPASEPWSEPTVNASGPVPPEGGLAASEPPNAIPTSAGHEPRAVVAAATATLEETPAEPTSGPPVLVSDERLKEIALRFAQIDDVRQVATFRADGEVVEVRGAALDVTELSRLAPSSVRLIERHGPIRSYYLRHSAGQLFLFPLRGNIIAVVGNTNLNLGAVFTALAALEEEL